MKSSLFMPFDRLFSLNKHCVLCQQASRHLICEFCSDDLPYIDLDGFNHNLLNIPKVKSNLALPEYDSLFAIGNYQWPYSYLIRKLKFSRKLLFANALADIFLTRLANTHIAIPDAIVPVPLHIRRLVDRQYNQAYQIARQISLHKSIPLLPDAVKRTKATAPQTQQSAKTRTKNLKDAFTLQGSIREKHIVVFDDVITTGATANAVCREIRKANPGIRIDLWCICISLVRR